MAQVPSSMPSVSNAPTAAATAVLAPPAPAMTAVPSAPDPVAPIAPIAEPTLGYERELLAAGIMPHTLRINPGTTDLLGQRVGAFLIDSVIANMIVFGIVLGFAIVSAFATGGSESAWAGFSLGADLTGGLLYLGYFVLFEAIIGATPGKKILGLKVVSSDGEKATLGQAFMRNLARIVDHLFFALPGIMSINNSPLHQRLGDRWAGTVVIRG